MCIYSQAVSVDRYLSRSSCTIAVLVLIGVYAIMLLSRPAACVVSQEHGDLALPTGARALPHDARPMLLSGHPESRIWTLSRPRPEVWPLQVHARVTASPTVDNGHDSAWSIAAPCPPPHPAKHSGRVTSSSRSSTEAARGLLQAATAVPSGVGSCAVVDVRTDARQHRWHPASRSWRVRRGSGA